jgi:hypothetical protein
MAKAVVNKAASVHQRLLNLARERKEDFGLVLTRYVLERVLYRISQSKYRDVLCKPVAFTSEFFASQDKKKQWHAFCNKNKNYIAQVALETTCLEIAAFLMPVLEAVRNNERLDRIWRAGGPWS